MAVVARNAVAGSVTIAPPIGGLLYDIHVGGVRGSWPYWAGAGILLLVSVFGFRIRHVQQRSVDS